MIKTSVQIPSSAVPDFAKNIRDNMRSATRSGAETIATQAKTDAHKKTARMAGSVKVDSFEDKGDTIVAVIGAGGQGAPHAQAQDGGSGLFGPKKAKYKISPKNKKALAFGNSSVLGAPGGKYLRLSGNLRSVTKKLIKAGKLPGAITVVRSVMHPGVKPTYFLSGASDKVADKLRQIFAEALSKVSQ